MMMMLMMMVRITIRSFLLTLSLVREGDGNIDDSIAGCGAWCGHC